MAVDLVFGADNLHHPLTGIGRYSLELAKRLESHEAITRVRYFSLGRWIASPVQELLSPQGSSSSSSTGAASLKGWLASKSWAVKGYSALSPALFAWRLRALGANDVFHAPSFFAPACKARKVVTVHDLSHEISPQFHPAARVELMQRALPPSMAIADHVITVSETIRVEVIERFGLNPQKVTATLLAADPVYRPHTSDMLRPAMQALGLRARQYSLFVGTVEPRKNVERLVMAYASLPAGLRKEFPLVIAGGSGWNSASIHESIEVGVSEGWLHYLSYLDQRWLPALYAGARLMAYPSLYEGFGLPIIEAMASDTPVLTSNLSCMPEVAGGAAALVDPFELDDIAATLQECLENEAWQSRARERGLRRAAELSWDICAEQTVRVYEQVKSA